jgi:hypothetical protein
MFLGKFYCNIEYASIHYFHHQNVGNLEKNYILGKVLFLRINFKLFSMNVIMENKFKVFTKEIVFWMKRWGKFRKMIKFSKMMETKIGKIKNELSTFDVYIFFLIIFITIQYNN